MKTPERVTPEVDVCELAQRWGIAGTLARKIRVMSANADLGLLIISGYRTCEQQAGLARVGRPAVACDVSTHTTCPATGADLWTTPAPVTAVKARFGTSAVLAGLRWGGGSQVDGSGIPADWNHVDLGPRDG